jgi:hypothetical protein
MELTFARNITKLQPNGEYVVVHESGTLCEECAVINGWGYTVFNDDKAGEKCDFCG